MKRRFVKTLNVFISLGLAVLAVLWAIYQRGEAIKRRAENQSLGVMRANLESQLLKVEGQIVSAQKEQVEQEATLAGLREKRSMANVYPCPVGSGGAVDLVMRDPVLQNLYLTSERASLAGRYAALFKKLDLASSQIEELEELVFRRNEQRMDLDDVVRSNHLDAKESSVVRLRAETTRSFRDRVVGLIGEPGYLIFTHYERTLPVAEFVNKLAGAVALQGEPLSELQASRLTEALANASPPYREGGDADTDKIEWLDVLAESPKFLTPPQQIAFRNAAPRYPVVVELQCAAEP